MANHRKVRSREAESHACDRRRRWSYSDRVRCPIIRECACGTCRLVGPDSRAGQRQRQRQRPSHRQLLAGSGNGNFGNNNLFIGGQNGNGNTTQTTWGAGNNMNTQLNLLSPVTGGSATNTGNVTATGGSSTATSSPTTTGNGTITGNVLGQNTANLDCQHCRRRAGAGDRWLQYQYPNGRPRRPTNNGSATVTATTEQGGCGAIGSCSNSGGSPSGTRKIATNGALNTATTTQTAEELPPKLRLMIRCHRRSATANGNTTSLNQTSGGPDHQRRRHGRHRWFGQRQYQQLEHRRQATFLTTRRTPTPRRATETTAVTAPAAAATAATATVVATPTTATDQPYINNHINRGAQGKWVPIATRTAGS